jgi:hypothetical protein
VQQHAIEVEQRPAAACADATLFNFELHGIDFLDAADDLEALRPYQPVVRVAVAQKIDARRALIIERDDGEGDPSMACAAGTQPSPENRCFATPARLKRVVLVDLQDTDAQGFVRRIGHIDLMAIRDPQNRARFKGEAKRDLAGLFTFPFFTIENVAVVDAEHIIVANDNNLPFSIGRFVDRAADNEFILLRVPEMLQAR